MGIFSELFFKTELSLNKGNNSWKAKQVQKVEKDIKKIKSNIEQLKGEIINREGQFEKLENTLLPFIGCSYLLLPWPANLFGNP